jgi:cation transport regulator
MYLVLFTYYVPPKPLVCRLSRENWYAVSNERRAPASVGVHLPDHAQDIYREAFNHAYAARPGDVRQEEAAHRIAWAAVKRSYVKAGGSWIARGEHGAA